MRPIGLALPHVLMERSERHAEPLRVAPNLIQRKKPVVDVKRRIFNPLGGHRAGGLLKFHDKAKLLLAVLLSPFIPFLQQQRPHEVKINPLTAGFRRLALATAGCRPGPGLGLVLGCR